jgi:hypothetical protein
MKLKTALTWVAALVVGMSLGQAQAASLLVDDFNSLSTPPASGNSWSQTGAPVWGTTREFSKTGGSFSQTGAPAGTMKFTATSGTNQLSANYDGNTTTGNTFISPTVDLVNPPPASTFLYVKGNFLTTATTTVQASIWCKATPMSGFTQHDLTLTGVPNDGSGYRFSLADFSPTPNLLAIGRVRVIFNDLGLGESFVDRIQFSVPEPSTFALAGLAVVGLVIARRNKK